MAITAPYTTSGASTGATPTGANPYGLDPQTMAYLQQIGGLGSTLAQGGGSSAPNMQRFAQGQQAVQGQPNNLLLAILQMRAQQAQALGQPYGQGVGMQPPRYSLLS